MKDEVYGDVRKLVVTDCIDDFVTYDIVLGEKPFSVCYVVVDLHQGGLVPEIHLYNMEIIMQNNTLNVESRKWVLISHYSIIITATAATSPSTSSTTTTTTATTTTTTTT